MNREIEFRAWDTADRLTLSDQKVQFFDLLTVNGQGSVNDFMQFTDLHDKNGVEIYEDDIVRVDDDWSEQTTHHLKWSGEYPAFEMYPGFDLESNNLMSALAGEGGMTLEVIGNIHENPDLLG